MSDESVEFTPNALVSASTISEKSPPSWLAAAILELSTWKTRGLLSQLQEIPWLRPAKRYVLLDIVLVLLVCAVSGLPSLRAFYHEMWSWQGCLAAIWNRDCLPSRSQFTKLLYFITQEHLIALQSLFLHDVAKHWPEHSLQGLMDHQGRRHLIFDLDPTRMTILERELGETEERPGAQRRAINATAPGYKGRKRGDRVRTRTVVHSPHSGMWILTFGHPGNPNHLDTLNRSADAIQTSCSQLHVPLSEAVVRMDGEWGHLKHLLVLKQKGLNYLVRVADYSVLHLPEVQAVLAQGSLVQLQLPDSPVIREIFDVPNCCWRKGKNKSSLETRFVISRRKAREDGKKERVGHKNGEWVYEVITTKLKPESVSASEVVSLYLERGSFEGVLGQEDAEMATDHWRSYSPEGEDLWQIVCQWVWNHRIQLGSTLPREKYPVERVLAFEVPTKEHDGQPVEWEWPEPQVVERVEKEVKETEEEILVNNIFGEKGVFTCDDKGFIHCPMGIQMRCVEKRQRTSGLRHRHEMWAKICASCPIREDCRPPNSSQSTGRKLDVRANLIASCIEKGETVELLSIPLTESSRSVMNQDIATVQKQLLSERTRNKKSSKKKLSYSTELAVEEIQPQNTQEDVDAAVGETSTELLESLEKEKLEFQELEKQNKVQEEKNPTLLWYDLAASSCRLRLQEQVGREQVKVRYEVREETDKAVPLANFPWKLETRDQRSHRRRTWKEKLELNTRSNNAPKLWIEVTGIPPMLAEAAGLYLAQPSIQNRR